MRRLISISVSYNWKLLESIVELINNYLVFLFASHAKSGTTNINWISLCGVSSCLFQFDRPSFFFKFLVSVRLFDDAIAKFCCVLKGSLFYLSLRQRRSCVATFNKFWLFDDFSRNAISDFLRICSLT